MAAQMTPKDQYVPSYKVAKQLQMSPLALSKMCSSLFVISKSEDVRFNIGLSLKFDSKKKKVIGYSQKTAEGWEYSNAAIDLLNDYKVRIRVIWQRFIYLSIYSFFFSSTFILKWLLQNLNTS